MLLPGARQVTVALNVVQGILLPIRKCRRQGKRERIECNPPAFFFIGLCQLIGTCLIPTFFVQKQMGSSSVLGTILSALHIQLI